MSRKKPATKAAPASSESRSDQSSAGATRPRRQLLLDTAYELFNAGGYHATGIDAIMEASGVSKTTLYKYFASKEELILEVLRRRHAELWDQYESRIAESRRKHPNWNDEEHLAAIFDALHAWINSPTFFGCNFINASAEYASPKDPIHRLADEHKRKLGGLIYELLDGRPKAERRTLAENILMIVDGAIVAAHVRGDQGAAKRARTIVDTLLKTS